MAWHFLVNKFEFSFEATCDTYLSCLQLTGDKHEEVESQNRLLDWMVRGLYFWKQFWLVYSEWNLL
jgi:hypothetical protein